MHPTFAIDCATFQTTTNSSKEANQLLNIFSNVVNLPDKWFSNCDPCTWQKIKCNYKGFIMAIDVSDLNLKGILDTSYQWPFYIEYINLSNNLLTNINRLDLLTMISNNHQIKYFNADSNHFTYDKLISFFCLFHVCKLCNNAINTIIEE